MKNRKTMLEKADVLLIAILLLSTAFFVVTTMTTMSKAYPAVVWSEDFHTATPPNLPSGWSTDALDNWKTSPTNFAGGTSPEAIFNWYPTKVGTCRLFTTNPIVLPWYDHCTLRFKHFVNNYYPDYTLKVETKTPGSSWNQIWSKSGGPMGPETITVPLTVKGPFYLSFTFEGDSFNINYWYIDDINIEWNNSLKWEQLPDKNWTGMDIMVNLDTEQFNRTLADDFLCTSTGPISDVHLWGSWFNDTKGTITKIHLGIHEDIPANNSNPSRPGKLLWQRDFYQGDFTEKIYLTSSIYEWWWDPYTDTLYPYADHNIWQIDIIIPQNNAFFQNGTEQNPVIYWLDASAIVENGSFGWKTAKTHWNDDAVWFDPSYYPTYWRELRYPYGHPYANQSIDMSFRITTVSQECCFGIAWPTYGQTIKKTQFPITITELCGENHTNVSWSITIANNGPGSIRCKPPMVPPLYPPGSRTYNYVISSFSAGSSVTVMSPIIWAAIWVKPKILEPRNITITVTVDGCSSVTQTATLSWIIGVGRTITIP